MYVEKKDKEAHINNDNAVAVTRADDRNKAAICSESLKSDVVVKKSYNGWMLSCNCTHVLRHQRQTSCVVVALETVHIMCIYLYV